VTPKIKGTAFHNRFEYLRQVHGEETLEKILARLSPEDAKALRLPVASEWYPIEAVIRVDAAITDLALGGKVERMAEIGEFSLVQNLTVLYRFLFHVLNTETLLQNGLAAFRKSVSVGTPAYRSLGPREVEVDFEGFNPVAKSYCHFTRGGIVGILKASGLRDYQVTKTACLLDGAKCCTYKASWK